MVVHDNWDVKTDINNTDQDQDDETNSKSKNVKISFHPSGQIKLDPMSSVSKKKPAKVQKVKNPKPEKPVVSQQLTISSEEDFPVSDKYTCQQCNEKCPTLFDMSEHNFMFHCSPDNRMYECPSCSYVCVKGGYMRQHIKQVHDSVKIGCPKCNRMIRDINLRAHLEDEHSDMPDKKFKCTYEECTYTAAKKVYLYNHIKQLHKKDEHTQKCDRCDKTFAYANALTRHVELVHLGLRPFVCEKCGKGYVTQSLLTEHQAKPTCNHGGVRQYKCERCDLDFCKVLSYVKHFHHVHGSQPPNMDAGPAFLCDSCPKMYLNQIALEKHRKHVHQGVPKGPRPKAQRLQCPHCEKRLVKPLLNEHIKSKHEKNTPYKCDQCTRSFGTSSVLQTHKLNLHRRVNCDLCGQNVCNSFWLKRHKASAHGITPKGSYQCPYCPLFFNLQGALENHVKKQHAEIP
jgi:KRAB domain-containing zinc finger protein